MDEVECMQGYYRYPTVHNERVVFVSEDDLWEVALTGGPAHRLTSGRGEVSFPAYSPDGAWLAFTATDEGATEVYVMPATGGVARQLTFDGEAAHTIGWTPDSAEIVFASTRQMPFEGVRGLFAISAAGGDPRPLLAGEAEWWSAQHDGPGRVLGTYRTDLARWKRYRGGQAGQLWIDLTGQGSWQRLLPEEVAGMVRPIFAQGRVWFLSDREGHGNLYSCTPQGEDLRRHTDHEGFFARFSHSDGRTIVYTVGGGLRAFDIASDTDRAIDVRYSSPRAQLLRKFRSATTELESYALHPRGKALAISARGKCFNLGLWEGAARQTGLESGARYALASFLPDGERLLVSSDAADAERLEIHMCDGSAPPEPVTIDAEIGRPIDLVVSPHEDRALVFNHRQELWHVDLTSGEARLLDRSEDQGASAAWSPDGRWIAYVKLLNLRLSQIMLVDTLDWSQHPVTDGRYRDVEPAFDPAGRYLYFLSYRSFNPVYGELFLELSFPTGYTPCLVTLRADEPSPLKPGEQAPWEEEEQEHEEAAARKAASRAGASASAAQDEGEEELDLEDLPEGAVLVPAVEIDLEGIGDRLLALPVPEGRYMQLGATRDRVFFIVAPPRGVLAQDEAIGGTNHDEDAGALRYFDLKRRRLRPFARGIMSFDISADGKSMAMASAEGLRVVSALGGPPDDDDEDEDDDIEDFSSASGWIDLERVQIEVEVQAEWRQMLRESWRLMRDHFWMADMGGLDWEQVWTRYAALLERVGSRAELSDVVWTMQGELGTSHAYEFGGDYRHTPHYRAGSLGAQIVWDPDAARPDGTRGAHRITRTLRGDSWRRDASSPLTQVGLDVREGDVLLAINGRALTEHQGVQQRLIRQLGQAVELLVWREGDEAARRITTRTLRDDRALRYRDWVRGRAALTELWGGGRVGYVHIPDMDASGYAEFHQAYLSQMGRDALIIDARYNGGGHISQLLLERLARRISGYDVPRYGAPIAHPMDATRGALVGITNARAGSDGDVFSHGFKLMGLGPLVGTRTWGGVVGMSPRYPLVDGSITTQPEYSFWVPDVGFGLENFGTRPDVEVEHPPGITWDDDPQLATAIKLALTKLQGAPPGPKPGPLPRLVPGPLPKR